MAIPLCHSDWVTAITGTWCIAFSSLVTFNFFYLFGFWPPPFSNHTHFTHTSHTGYWLVLSSWIWEGNARGARRVHSGKSEQFPLQWVDTCMRIFPTGCDNFIRNWNLKFPNDAILRLRKLRHCKTFQIPHPSPSRRRKISSPSNHHWIWNHQMKVHCSYFSGSSDVSHHCFS